LQIESDRMRRGRPHRAASNSTPNLFVGNNQLQPDPEDQTTPTGGSGELAAVVAGTRSTFVFRCFGCCAVSASRQPLGDADKYRHLRVQFDRQPQRGATYQGGDRR
jgi:hypothetical protein